LSRFCHQRPIFVTDPGLLVPQLSLLIPFLSLRRAALYKEEEKGKRNCLGLVACEKKLIPLATNRRKLPAEQREKSWNENLRVPCPTQCFTPHAALAMCMPVLAHDKSSVCRQTTKEGLKNLGPER
jgi:hypothetical protein